MRRRVYRPYSNDRIYRIIGGVVCERKGFGFVCKSRSAVRDALKASGEE